MREERRAVVADDRLRRVRAQESDRRRRKGEGRSRPENEGRVPLQTLRADIDFGVYEAHTKYGVIGVKVWIFKGEVLEREVLQAPKKEAVNAAA